MAGVVEKLALQSHWAAPSHGLWSDIDHGPNYSSLSLYIQLHHKSPLYNLCELHFIFSAIGPNLEGFFSVYKPLFTHYVASKSCLSFRSQFKVTSTRRMSMIHREGLEHPTAHCSRILLVFSVPLISLVIILLGLSVPLDCEDLLIYYYFLNRVSPPPEHRSHAYFWILTLACGLPSCLRIFDE